MSQGLNLVCQPPLTIAVTVPSIQERYALAPTVRAQLMAGNSSSWDIADNHTGLPTGINLQAPVSQSHFAYHHCNTACVNTSRVPVMKNLIQLNYLLMDLLCMSECCYQAE